MKQPIALISNDWHLEPSNTELVINIIKDKIKEAKKLNITNIFILGDVFHDRKSQRQVVLNAFRIIMNMFEVANLDVIFITGNHDRSDYSSSISFLTPFNFNKNIIDDFYNIENDEYVFKLAPFFIEELWIEKFKEFKLPINKSTKKKILLTHVAFQGSINNDGSTVSTPIKPSMFKDYDIVLSGHYHNFQQVAPNIYHLPSLYQRNYGEDSNKGFTVLYDNLSFDIIKSNFPEFKKVEIDIDSISKKDLEEQIKVSSKDVIEGSNVRFVFKGSEKKIKAIKRDIFSSNGIDVKTKIKAIEEISIEFNDEVKKLDIETIYIKFSKFCEDEDLELETGQTYLDKILKE